MPITKKTGRRAALATTLASVGIAAGLAGTAESSSVGCTNAAGPAGSYMCLTINGSGLTVNSFRVTYQKYKENICNGTAKVVVTSPTGTRWTYGPKSHAGTCNTHVSWVDFTVNRQFPHNSTACGYFYEGGRSVGGPACNKILR